MGLFSTLFGKKKQPVELGPIDMSLVKCDVHGHLLPGIDDGSDSLQQSVEMVQGLVELGYERITCTPHVMTDFYRNPTERILEKLEELRAELKRQEINIEIEASAEYYFDEELKKRLENDDILSFGKQNNLLFEFSYFNEHSGVLEIITEMFAKGYTPLLAHPERYPYFAQDFTKYEGLKNSGVKFQINLLSLIGHYGEGAMQVARWMIDNGMVDYIGTDIHKPQHLGGLKKALKDEHLHKLISTGNLLNATLFD